ncbi:MAG: hypothetical protein ACTSQU_18580 [Promethearchaeota archaeon]
MRRYSYKGCIKKTEIKNRTTIKRCRISGWRVESLGGEIHILSSEHPTGQQIIDLGSIVAILRFKI